jgi:glucosamine--fructose-6-phosphate aminotransferase (isomerizing)
MCGIAGYIGYQPAIEIIFDSLKKLEYRGYDSCGVAVAYNGNLQLYKDKLRVAGLIKSAPHFNGTVGIGHTRWATCGEPTKNNAHPHSDCNGKIAVVHNGTIDNFQDLKNQLVEEGHIFTSETVTEVIPHLIEKYYNGNLEQAVATAIKEIQGSYAIAVVIAEENVLVVAKQRSPLVIGISDKEYIIASDTTAILGFTDHVIYPEEGDICLITPSGLHIRNKDKPVKRKEKRIDWNNKDIELAGYPHYMLKEIHEQPKVILNTIASVNNGIEERNELPFFDPKIAKSILMVACGTSYYSSLVNKYILEAILKVPVRVELASEINYFPAIMDCSHAVAVSQSGETADTIQAARRIKASGCKLVAITNVKESQLSRIADYSIYTNAGPEISVASTKTFISQITVFYAMAIAHPFIDVITKRELETEICKVPILMRQILNDTSQIEELGRYLANFNNVFYIARGINYPISMEGALKLKEIAYIHSEGYAAGELKHGPFALLDEKTPVVAIAAQDETYNAMLTNLNEVKTRKAPVIALVEQGDEEVTKIVDYVIEIPHVNSLVMPMLNVLVLQLLAYYTAASKNCPIDFPRNLAKTVTVE